MAVSELERTVLTRCNDWNPIAVVKVVIFMQTSLEAHVHEGNQGKQLVISAAVNSDFMLLVSLPDNNWRDVQTTVSHWRTAAEDDMRS